MVHAGEGHPWEENLRDSVIAQRKTRRMVRGGRAMFRWWPRDVMRGHVPELPQRIQLAGGQVARIEGEDWERDLFQRESVNGYLVWDWALPVQWRQQKQMIFVGALRRIETV